MSHQDIITKLEEKCLIKKENIPAFLKYIDPDKKGYLEFIDFSKKIRRNMVWDDEDGKPKEKTVITFEKPNVDEENMNATLTKRILEEIKRPFEPGTYSLYFISLGKNKFIRRNE